jgi:hypothetical protein
MKKLTSILCIGMLAFSMLFTACNSCSKPEPEPEFTGYNFDEVIIADYDLIASQEEHFFFRTAEAYLTYAEATARLNGGSATADGVAAINAVRSRANAVTRSGYSLNDILDEWSREFYFEGRRRVDLIRFGKFGGNSDYKWEWKGVTLIGRNFDSYRNIFAIPASQLSTYGNVQNPGY